MPIDLVNVEWLNSCAQRRYPLSASATAKDVTGTFTLPDDFILELYLPVHAGLDVSIGNFHIRAVQSYAAGFTVVVGYTPTGGDPIIVASAMIARLTHTPGQTYALGGIGDFADCVGRITIGSLDNIDRQPAGLFYFDLAGGLLETDAIRPMIRYISALRIVNGTDISEPIVGDIVLQAGSNMNISVVESLGEDPVLVFDAIEGAGLSSDCVCTDTVSPPIRTINGVAPDSSGNFVLAVNTCLAIESLTNGLQLQDICSQPCCGPAELQVIVQTLTQLQTQLNTLANFVDNLSGVVDQMDLVVLGSRLGDRDCTAS